MSFNRHGTLLTAVMIAALVTAIAGAVRRFAPGWRPELLIGVCFLIALETGFVHYTARRERMSLGELARYLVPELFVMAVLMRAAATLSTPAGGGAVGIPAAFAADLERWLYDPLSVFEPLFVLYCIAGLLVGALAHASLRDLAELAPRPFETPEALSEGSRRYLVQLAEDRSAAIRRVGRRFLLGGMVLLLALGLEAVNLERLGGRGMPISAPSTVGTLVYVVAGFLLYSQARLALLRARWQQEGAQVADTVARRWNRSSWLLIIAVVGGAALLPRTYGRGLLETLNAGLALVGYALALLGYLVLWLFGMIVALPAWLLSLLLPAGGPVTPPAPPPAPPLPPEVTREPRLLPALVFWLCMLALAVYAARIVAQRHPGLLRAILSRGPLARLLGWLASLWGDASSWAGQVAQAAREMLRKAADAPPRSPFRAIRLNALTPRELVRYFYRSTLRRASQRGVGRRSGQTPYEYEAALMRLLPEAEPDIANLTEAFVLAQYTRRPVGAAEARQARGPWQRLRRALRVAGVGHEDRRAGTNHEDTKTRGHEGRKNVP
ncbi:MAG TPA: DUF4129 domain-containing protein [Roseiflexaceae bacterium]|nr:DUF4129 domain-containing protein [Roseiflexaceae bacterium]